jgi:predicted dehydrogenase
MTEIAGPSRVRVGMVGGGIGSFIGVVHRIAGRRDDQFELVAGALSSEASRGQESGKQLRLRPDRVYPDWGEIAKAEASRPDKVDAVVIATPNHLNSENAVGVIESGFDIICDKPLTVTLELATAARVTRTPAELPEGHLECFANNYLDAAELNRAAQDGRPADPDAISVPQIDASIEAAAFVEAVIQSGKKRAWVNVDV